MKVLSLVSIKGGVGKTASAVNLAAEATRSGARVLVWDLDPQGATTYLLRSAHELAGDGGRGLVATGGELAPQIRATSIPGLELLPSDVSLRYLDRYLDAAGRPRRRIGALLRPVADRYDLAVIDCPAGASLAVDSVVRASDVLLVPVVPTTLAVRTLQQLEELVATRSKRPDVLAHVSIHDRRRRLQREVADQLLARPSTLSAVVPASSLVERMGVQRAPVAAYAPRSAAATAYRQLWDQLSSRLWG